MFRIPNIKFVDHFGIEIFHFDIVKLEHYQIWKSRNLWFLRLGANTCRLEKYSLINVTVILGFMDKEFRCSYPVYWSRSFCLWRPIRIDTIAAWKMDPQIEICCRPRCWKIWMPNFNSTKAKPNIYTQSSW